MKKNFNKIASLVLAASLIGAMPVTAFAAEKLHKITVTNVANDEASHTYAAYQIFAGDLSNGTLSNITWGTGVNTSLITGDVAQAIVDATGVATDKVTDAAAVAAALSEKTKDNTTDPQVAQDFADAISKALGSTSGTSKDNTIEDLDDGYYFVEDTTDLTGKKASKSRFILRVLGDDITVEAKSDVPTVTKKVDDVNDSTGASEKLQDSADYDIGDYIPYTITGTMPSNIDKYETYKYEFTDTMSKGLTFANDVAIKIGDKDVTSAFTQTITSGNDGATVVTWDCRDLKAIEGVTLAADSKVVLTYKAELNKDAVFGVAGNPNTVDLTFSNNPNKGGEGDTGKTPEDKNIVYTYKLEANKYMNEVKDGNELEGAKFKLYKLVSDSSKTGINDKAAQTGTAIADELKAKDATKGVVTSAFTTDAHKDAYFIDLGEQEGTGDKKNQFFWEGIDDGTYVLVETVTPAGYNSYAANSFKVEATHDAKADEPELKTLNGNKITGDITLTADDNKTTLSADVVNVSGSQLPTTGGMGTTILYVAGAILVIAGAAVLVIKKRHEA